MDNNDNGTNAASSENNNSQFVMYWANNIDRIFHNTTDSTHITTNQKTNIKKYRKGSIQMTHFNKESFDKALDQGKLMMVDFWADWCGPCRMLGPVIKDLADRYEGKAVVGKVNVDDEQELAIRYGVMSIPTVIFFKDGKEVDRIRGLVKRPELEDKVKTILE